MAYSLYTSTGSITDEQIITSLDASIPLQAAHIRAIRNLQRDMCRYSNQDLDVLSAAHTVAITGRTEVNPWEAKWVEVMTRRGA
jgi:hypothetical protein